MNDENKFFEKIKASLDRASSIIDIKNKIEIIKLKYYLKIIIITALSLLIAKGLFMLIK